jgi:putative flippase GtrA
MPMLKRAARCMVVSIFCTIFSTTILIVLAVGFGMRAGYANAIAVTCGIIPSYFANRSWVWERSGKSSVGREVAPFWVLNIAGLIISTVLVDIVGNATTHWSDTARSIALPAANLTVFGVLWILQFFVLDRYIFHDRTRVLATVSSLEQP